MPFSCFDFSGGVNTLVAPFLMKDSECEELVNYQTDVIGSLKKRKGYTELGSATGAKDVLGLHNYCQNDGSTRYFLRAYNTDVYKWVDPDWTALSDTLTADLETEFETFVNYCFWTNGTDAVHSWDGTTIYTAASGALLNEDLDTSETEFDYDTETGTMPSAGTMVIDNEVITYTGKAGGKLTGCTRGCEGTTAATHDNDATITIRTNIDSAPTGKYIKAFVDRLYISGNSNYPSRVYYSSIPNAYSLRITWTTADDYFDVVSDDGDIVKGFGVNADRLLIFKENSLWRWSSTKALNEVAKIGTTCNRSIATISNVTFWLHRTGVWSYFGGQVRKVSDKVKDYIDGISDFTTVCATAKGNHYQLYIGTSNGVTNCMLDYNIAQDSWAVHSLADVPKVFTPDTTVGSTTSQWFGTDNGEVMQWAYGNDDNGTAISTKAVTKEYPMGAPELDIEPQKLFVFSQKALGTAVKYRIDRGDWETAGNLTGRCSMFSTQGKGKTLQYEFTETSTKESQLEGLVQYVKDERTLSQR